MRNYAGLQSSKVNELQSLVDHAGACETSGHSGALLPLSRIVRERYQSGETIVNLEQLEHEAVQWYTRKGMKSGFECLHVAFVRLQGHEINVNDERLGVLLDWIFHEADVTLVLGNGGYDCPQKTMNEMIDWLLEDIRGGIGTGLESQARNSSHEKEKKPSDEKELDGVL